MAPFSHTMACAIFVSDQGSNPYPLHWKYKVLTTGLPGKFPQSLFWHIFLNGSTQSLLCITTESTPTLLTTTTLQVMSYDFPLLSLGSEDVGYQHWLLNQVWIQNQCLLLANHLPWAKKQIMMNIMMILIMMCRS